MYRTQLQPVLHAIPRELDLWWMELEPETSYRARRERCREALIQALSTRLGRTVEHSEIVTGASGKPRLESSEIGFNLSHSGREVLIGIAAVGELGVDLEVMRSVPEAEALVAEYCTTPERNDWSRTTASERDAWLLNCWTRKEACLNCMGAGLAVSPAVLKVGPGPDPARVRIDCGRFPSVIEVYSTVLPSGSPAAVAVPVATAAESIRTLIA